MKIGIAQTAPIGDPSVNCRKIEHYIELAKNGGGDVVCFPEMSDTGYDVSTIRKKASAWNEEPHQSIQRAAQKFSINVVAGLSEKIGGSVFNSVAVFDAGGNRIGKYRKVHLYQTPPLEENKCFSAGDDLGLIEIDGVRCGLMICYDLRFPEMARALALAGAEVLIVLSAWPFPRVGHWKVLTEARAIENQTFVVACNRTGKENDVVFCGCSRVVDPYGVIINSAAEDREELIIATVDPAQVKSLRSRYPIYSHRRPEVYGLGQNGRLSCTPGDLNSVKNQMSDSQCSL